MDKIIKESQETCDFCRAENFTVSHGERERVDDDVDVDDDVEAEETWGRVKTPYCITGANMFRLSGPNNGLVLSRTHHLLELGPQELEGMMNCCRTWYSKVHQSDPSLVAPMMLWDTLGHSGASQIHPHIQLWLGRDYEGQFNLLERHARDYRQKHGSNYYQDLVELHTRLGLAVTHGQATALVPLTSHKDHEVMIVSREVGPDFLHLFTRVMEMYNEKLGVFCRSLGMRWPRLDRRSGLAILRVGSRGACDSQISDVSSLELYGVFNVNVEPLHTINTLRAVLEHA